MREFIFKIKDRIQAYLQYIKCRKHYKHYLLRSGFPAGEQEGEREYLAKWSQLTKRVEPYSYRFFSNFCGTSSDIVPEDIGNMIIEKLLNLPPYRSAYADKNMFPVILGNDVLPKTICCRVNGGQILDSEYAPIFNGVGYLFDYQENAMILKPTVGSCSGRGIMKFERGKDGEYYSTEGIRLTSDFLNQYSKDFCLQESVCQSPFTAQFNPASVNTLRLAIYRSVKDDEVHVVGSIIRMGKHGQHVDNAHSGGVFVGIDSESGVLGKYAVNEFGEKFDKWNDADLKNKTYCVPNWDEVVKFSERIGRRILHHRLVALDIALDSNNKPVLIEYNIGAFSYWLFMLTGHTPLGNYTDEIIDYCKNNK